MLIPRKTRGSICLRCRTTGDKDQRNMTDTGHAAQNHTKLERDTFGLAIIALAKSRKVIINVVMDVDKSTNVPYCVVRKARKPRRA